MQRKMHPADRYLRLATGVASLSSAVYGRRQSALTRALLAGFGAMKIAEAVTGFCPMKASVERLANPSGVSTESTRQWVQKAARAVGDGAKRAAQKAQDAVEQAADLVHTKSDTPIPDEVAKFLVEDNKREPSDEDNA